MTNLANYFSLANSLLDFLECWGNSSSFGFCFWFVRLEKPNVLECAVAFRGVV